MLLHILDSHLRSEYLDNHKQASDIFIETGAWAGDNAELMRQYGFKTIWTIENDEERFQQCWKRFGDVLEVNAIYNPSSAEALRRVLAEITVPVTIWLDSTSHPTQGHPLLEELEVIKAHPIKEHTIFIDDRRLFGSDEWGAWVTEDAAMKLLGEINPDYQYNKLDGAVPQDILVATIVWKNKPVEEPIVFQTTKLFSDYR